MGTEPAGGGLIAVFSLVKKAHMHVNHMVDGLLRLADGVSCFLEA